MFHGIPAARGNLIAGLALMSAEVKHLLARCIAGLPVTRPLRCIGAGPGNPSDLTATPKAFLSWPRAAQATALSRGRGTTSQSIAIPGQ